MSTHPVRRLFPGLRARRRYRRQPFCHHPGNGQLGAKFQSVDFAKHPEQYRLLGPPAVARFPGKHGVFDECLLQDIHELCYDMPTTKAQSLATMGLDCSALGVPDRGPMMPPETQLRKDTFRG